jgi:dipeptidyl aminopeptidase/acylaminoacyl peptidase
MPKGSSAKVPRALFAALFAAICWPTCLAFMTAQADDLPAYPSNEDLRHVRGLAEPRVSPGGDRILIQITDATADGGRGHLWLVDAVHGNSRQLTWSPEADKRGEFHGRWLGNGASILFLAKRTERTQLFRLPMSGGEAHAYEPNVAPVVDASAASDAIPPKKKDEAAKPDTAKSDTSPPGTLPLEIDDYDAAPDGRSIAIIARDPETAGEKKQKDAKADAIAVNRDPHGKRLYFMDAESGKLTAVAVPPDVTKIIWSEQSDRLIVLAEGPNDAGDLGPDATAWLVQFADPAHPSKISELPPTIEDGTWSSDGTRFYYRAQASRDAPPGYGDLFVLNMITRTTRNLTEDFAGSVDGSRPIVLGDDVIQGVELGLGRTYLRIHDARSAPLAFDHQATQLDSDAKHSAWAWLVQSGSQPAALMYSRQLGGGARVLGTTMLLPHAFPAAPAHIVHWNNEGLKLEGLLYLPPQAATGKVPLIVNVHGGPTGVWSDTFYPSTLFWLGHGWAVFLPNPRGSTGYGAAFAAANKNDLGGGDYRDIMSGVDAVLAGFAIDPEKLVLMGYSYGGEMAGFVEGNTDRFKCIISGAPVIDQQSEYGTEHGSWYDRWFYGKPWENAQAAWRQSPLANVAHAKTPFLLIQGEADSTDPLGQSQEMYRALRQAGVKVEMVQYPREDHGPLSRGFTGFPSNEPWHGFDARQRMVDFINAGLGK